MRTPGEIERALKLCEHAAAYMKSKFKEMGMPDHEASQQPPMMAALSMLTAIRWVAGADTQDAKSFAMQLDGIDRILNDNGGVFVGG